MCTSSNLIIPTFCLIYQTCPRDLSFYTKDNCLDIKQSIQRYDEGRPDGFTSIYTKVYSTLTKPLPTFRKTGVSDGILGYINLMYRLLQIQESELC